MGPRTIPVKVKTSYYHFSCLVIRRLSTIFEKVYSDWKDLWVGSSFAPLRRRYVNVSLQNICTWTNEVWSKHHILDSINACHWSSAYAFIGCWEFKSLYVKFFGELVVALLHCCCQLYGVRWLCYYETLWKLLLLTIK